MGDVAMTVPVLRALVLQHPDVKITVVSRPFFQPFFEGIPNVNFFGVDLKERHKGFIGLFRLFSDLRKLDIDLVADLHNVLRSKVVRTLFALSGKKFAATDKGRAEKKALTSLTNKVFAPVKPMVERHVDTFNQLGFLIDLANPKFPEKAILSDEILKIIGEIPTFVGMNWIGIAPYAQYESKVYPQDLMQQVIDDLAKNKNIKIFLFGGGSTEIQKLNQLQNNHENVMVVAGKLSFEAEILLISNLDVMLSMDSGNSHIAAMLGVKVITLWGATHPYAGFKPFNQPDDFCLTADRAQFPLLPISIYGNKKVEGYDEVMRTILPSQVIEKINSNLT
jgi:ADP-heptose:LPS heptosyltransferase